MRAVRLVAEAHAALSESTTYCAAASSISVSRPASTSHQSSETEASNASSTGERSPLSEWVGFAASRIRESKRLWE